MEVDISKGLFYTDGNLVRAGLAVIAAGFNAEPNAGFSRVVFLLEGEWHHFDVETDMVISVTSTGYDCYVAGAGGLTMRIPFPPRMRLEEIGNQIQMWLIEDAQDFGEITRVRAIGSRPYCCGQSGQVYCLVGDEWSRADAGLRADEGPDFEDIDGTGPSDVYAVGVEGTMYHFNGQHWQRVDLPTNLNLSNVRCVSPNQCYACGDDGLVLHGNGERWEILSESQPDKRYWGMEIFQSALYLAHGGGIDRLTDEGIQPVELPLNGALSFHRLHGRDSQLWSFGIDHVLLFDNATWRRIDIPVNY